MNSSATLYSRDVLALATSLANWPLDPALPLRGTARSGTCGSTIEIGLGCDARGRIDAVGLQARACAIGQAAAAIFAESAAAASADELQDAQTAIETWLDGGPMPDWPGLVAIAAARDYPARHGAILLPWRAALVAMKAGG